ncbi:Glucan endo-1,3-beta-glucosidase A1-like protein [Hapsidospora chrysogenum ATCC 11550]|uniref:Glucan endo-1,3-beta-glucosidase A1-like protein n=1 Tax=Hapsidospora chrysogenum (strain ATCC 11550 / CBS 779.69 / DSM 880 / IAM 14645 / JCM 23072 / IMI 49137) TaxID=857340 RepID=A0A086SWK8_HAPC1|nr:Glucan endo-1,3-beta-glucosidase A1-like protein [Hapsidospora chrysogenum ATCC 11550]
MKASVLYGALVAAHMALAIKAPSIKGMKTAWHDDFHGCAGCSPNLDEWEFRLDINHNNELQTYTNTNKNVQLSGGQTLQIVPWKDERGRWTSGRIETLESWAPEPGKKLRWQAGIRMGDDANRKGMWPAFWMLGDAVRHGTDWPRCGELDIFEQVNGVMEGYGTIHCDRENGGVCDEPNGRGAAVPIPNNEFHSWALEVDRTSGDWKTETITWFMDGNPFHRQSGADIGDEGVWSTLAHSPFYMILNIAVGGNWPGNPDASTHSGYGNMMEVQYVAVYTT